MLFGFIPIAILIILEGFVDAMARFGYTGLSPSDIVTTGKQIREEISKEDPIKAKALSHTQIRSLAIRREIEKIILERKLQACADDWATQVSSLSPLVVANAKKYVRERYYTSVWMCLGWLGYALGKMSCWCCDDSQSLPALSFFYCLGIVSFLPGSLFIPPPSSRQPP
jgi:hypothetical protein